MKITRLLPDGGEESAVLESEILIGRGEGDFVIRDDLYLSTRHAVVRLENGLAMLDDADSTNGTYLKVVGEIELRPGDYIRIGSQTFKFLV